MRAGHRLRRLRAALHGGCAPLAPLAAAAVGVPVAAAFGVAVAAAVGRSVAAAFGAAVATAARVTNPVAAAAATARSTPSALPSGRRRAVHQRVHLSDAVGDDA